MRRMVPRDPHEAHRAATPLELLFDLCFVGAAILVLLAAGSTWAVPLIGVILAALVAAQRALTSESR